MFDHSTDVLQLDSGLGNHMTSNADELVPNAASNPEQATDAIVRQYAVVTGACGQQVEALRAFLLQALKKHQDAAQPAPAPLMLEPAMASKEQRTAVHRLFKCLPGFPQLLTNTVEVTPGAQQDQQGGQPMCDGQHQDQQQQQQATADADRCKLQHIELHMKSGGRGEDTGRGQKRKWRQEFEWPGGSQRYTKFVLFKENMDSQVGKPADCG